MSRLGLLAVGLAACAGGPSARAGAVSPPPAHEFRLGPEDVVEIVVWDNPALSRTVPVRPDGMISLPLVDDVAAAGLTPIELRDLVATRLRRLVPNPVVSVIVQAIHSPKVLVVGEVTKPGLFEIKGPTTVLDAIALAGGFTEFASGGDLFLLRRRGPHLDRMSINRDALGATPSPWLAPGDVVWVP